jgi:hypothetical protein
MFITDGECFKERLDIGCFKFKGWDKLIGPIDSFKIERNDDLQLCLETTSSESAYATRINFPVGSVYQDDSKAELEGFSGQEATIFGLNITGSVENHSDRGILVKETSIVSKLVIRASSDKEEKYLVEQVCNIDDHFMFRDRFSVIKTDTLEMALGSDDLLLSIPKSMESKSLRNCLSVRIAGVGVYVISSNSSDNNAKRSGLIIYDQVPSDEIRKKIRGGLSYTLGYPIVYLGYTTYSIDWDVLSTEAVTPYTIGGQMFGITSLPPSPIGKYAHNDVDSKIVERMSNALIELYDQYDLNNVLWNYWHSVCAPTHMKPINFGAMIEFFQRQYLSVNDATVDTKLLSKGTSKDFRKAVLDLIISMDIPAEGKAVLKNKINNINQLPHSIQADRFFSAIGLTLGELEKKAIKRRNDAAHGVLTSEDDTVNLIKDNKILKIILDRIILSITQANSSYLDYYSLDHPERNISQPIHYSSEEITKN